MRFSTYLNVLECCRSRQAGIAEHRHGGHFGILVSDDAPALRYQRLERIGDHAADRLRTALADLTAERDSETRWAAQYKAERDALAAELANAEEALSQMREAAAHDAAELATIRKELLTLCPGGSEFMTQENGAFIPDARACLDWIARRMQGPFVGLKNDNDRLQSELTRTLDELAAEKKARAAFQMYGMMWEQSEGELAVARKWARRWKALAEYWHESYAAVKALNNANCDELATIKALCREAAVYVSWLPVEGCPCGTCNEVRDFLARLRGEE